MHSNVKDVLSTVSERNVMRGYQLVGGGNVMGCMRYGEVGVLFVLECMSHSHCLSCITHCRIIC